jgi:hypothetical protein
VGSGIAPKSILNGIRGLDRKYTIWRSGYSGHNIPLIYFGVYEMFVECAIKDLMDSSIEKTARWRRSDLKLESVESNKISDKLLPLRVAAWPGSTL